MSKLLLIACVVLAGCASRSDRVVAQALEGLAYDANYLPTPGGDAATLAFLKQRAEWLGAIVEYRPAGHPDLQGATGLSYWNGNQRHALVSEGLSVNGRIEVLAHEMGHLFQPAFVNRSEADAFAEFVSVEVCRRLGIDTTRATSGYLRAHKSTLRIGRVYRREIDFVADMLTRGWR